MDNSGNLSRRRFIVLASGLTLPAVWVGCRRDSGADADGEPPPAGGSLPPDDNTVSIALSDHPALATDGGYVTIAASGNAPDLLLVRNGARVHAFVNLCTHQACPLEPDSHAGVIRCDSNCGHGSLYSMAGELLQGPSESNLYEFESSLDPDTERLTIRLVLIEG